MTNPTEPTREEVDRLPGPVLLEFGASWCPHCQAMEPGVAELLKKYPTVKHIRIEDGKGKRLGRSFRVKLWPNFVFLKDGQPLGQLARPALREVDSGLQEITRS